MAYNFIGIGGSYSSRTSNSLTNNYLIRAYTDKVKNLAQPNGAPLTILETMDIM